MMQLRDYQERAVEKVEAAWKTGNRRVVLCMPTGSGKTEVALALIQRARAQGRMGLVVCDRKVLVRQTAARFTRHGLKVGIVQGENTFVASDATVVVASVQTLLSRWANPWIQGLMNDSSMVVIDESHVLHKHHATLLDRLTVPAVGLTATPLREGLGKHFQQIVAPVTIAELQQAGHLVRVRYLAPSVNDILARADGVSVRGGDFIEEELSKLMRDSVVIGDAVRTWKEKAENRLTLAFCVDRAHAAELANEFAAAGVSSAFIDYLTTDEDRERIFAAFRCGEVRVLCSVGVLGVGYDEPRAACAILARPTLSLSLHIQQAGRVLRPFDGKTDALILDHAGNVLRHGRVEDFKPPERLLDVDRDSDKKSRHERAELVPCSACETVYPRSSRVCPACGHIRVRLTRVCVVDGELRALDLDDNPQAANEPSDEDVRMFHRMMLHACESRGWKPGRAYFLTLRRFRLRDGFKLPREWRFDLPTGPDADAGRWLQNELRRQTIAYRNRVAA
jgi:DNA repair protein RadD